MKFEQFIYYSMREIFEVERVRIESRTPLIGISDPSERQTVGGDGKIIVPSGSWEMMHLINGGTSFLQ